MSNEIIPEVMVIASAIRQAFEMDANPGNTVHGAQNPAQLHLNGFFDIQGAARRAWAAISEHQEAKRQAQQKANLEAAAKLAAAANTGSVGTAADSTILTQNQNAEKLLA
jgi:hypothetical protein